MRVLVRGGVLGGVEIDGRVGDAAVAGSRAWTERWRGWHADSVVASLPLVSRWAEALTLWMLVSN